MSHRSRPLSQQSTSFSQTILSLNALSQITSARILATTFYILFLHTHPGDHLAYMAAVGRLANALTNPIVTAC